MRAFLLVPLRARANLPTAGLIATLWRMTPPHPPAPSPGSGQDGDVVDRIDAAVDAARDDECFCGCGVMLTVDSPSLYFADEPCQRSFIAQQAARAAGDHEKAGQLRAQRRETAEQRTARHRREILEDARRREDRAGREEAVRLFLRANGIDPRNVLLDKPIVTTGRTVRVSQYVHSPEGHLLMLPDRIPAVEVSYPQLLPWPDGLTWEHHYEEDDVVQLSLLDAPTPGYRMTVGQAVALMGHGEAVDAVALPDDNPLSYRRTCGYCGQRGAPYGYTIHQFSHTEPARHYQVCEHCGDHSPDPATAATLALSTDEPALTLTLTEGERYARRVIPADRLADYRHLGGVWSDLDEELLELRRRPIADMRAIVARGDTPPPAIVAAAPVGTPPGADGWVEVGYTDGEPMVAFDGDQADAEPVVARGWHIAGGNRAVTLDITVDQSQWKLWRRTMAAFLGISRNAARVSEVVGRMTQPADDPLLRAIEAKKRRNTGPESKRRAPRRIDPHRGGR